MKILLFGKNGQLGWELDRTLAPLGEVVSLDYPEIDFTKPKSLHQTIAEIRPHVLVNAVAYTDVDGAEREPHLARQVNALAPGEIAEAARRQRAPFIHYSTDFVFDGTKGTPYDESDMPHPINTYGVTKLQGEKAVQEASESYLILRTSWVYSLRRDNFVKKVLRWARTQTSLKIVSDQIGSPTWARLLAEITAQILALGLQDGYEFFRKKRGVYHLAGAGQASRFEFARKILELDPARQEQIAREILPASSEEFPTPAKRPPNTALDCTLFRQRFGLSLPPWEHALSLMFSG